jgi:hypothetical protein
MFCSDVRGVVGLSSGKGRGYGGRLCHGTSSRGHVVEAEEEFSLNRERNDGAEEQNQETGKASLR